MKRFALYTVLAFALLLVASCSDDEKYLKEEGGKEIGTKTYTLITGDTAFIKFESSMPIKYGREDSYNVKVTSKGEIIALRIGQGKVLVTNSKDLVYLDVTVNPKYFAYPDPFLEFGASKSVVTGKLGSPSQATDTELIYENYSEAAASITYRFAGDKLTNVIVKGLLEKKDAIERYLGERYVQYANNPDPHNEAYYMNTLKFDDATIKIDTTHEGEFLMINYYKP